MKPVHDNDDILARLDLVTIFNLLQQAQEPVDDWLPERDGPTVEEVHEYTLKQLGLLPNAQ
jgi:hypothetical protein